MRGAVTKGASRVCPREIGQSPRRARQTAAGEPGPVARAGGGRTQVLASS